MRVTFSLNVENLKEPKKKKLKKVPKSRNGNGQNFGIWNKS